jgi:hypothetical protein
VVFQLMGELCNTNSLRRARRELCDVRAAATAVIAISGGIGMRISKISLSLNQSGAISMSFEATSG